MTQFHQQSFAARFGAMGDEAEAKFEETHSSGWVRFGLNRPPLSMQMLPPLIRYTPDYLTSHGLVEVQGVGRDRQLKLKIEKSIALQQWHQHFSLRLFVWDSKKEETHYIEWSELWPKLQSQPIERFPEGKAYWAVDIDEF